MLYLLFWCYSDIIIGGIDYYFIFFESKAKFSSKNLAKIVSFFVSVCLWEHVYIYLKYTRVTYVKRAELESIFPLTLYFLNSVWFLTTCRNILSFPSLSSEDSEDMAGSDSLVIHNPQYFPPFISLSE